MYLFVSGTNVSAIKPGTNQDSKHLKLTPSFHRTRAQRKAVNVTQSELRQCENCHEQRILEDGLCECCRYIQRSKGIEREKLPKFHKLILKIPNPPVEIGASGVFWAVIVPLLVFLNSLLTLFILMFFSFPINLLLVIVIPLPLMIAFIKVSLERFINFWNLLVRRTGFKWNVDERTEEYITLLKKQKKHRSEE